MNTRFQELAEQATTKISFRLDPNTYKHIDDPDGDLERFEFDKEKFAELIVKECAGIAKHHVMNISTYADADFVDEQIRKHFGEVE